MTDKHVPGMLVVLALVFIVLAVGLSSSNRNLTTTCPTGQFPNGENATGAFVRCATATASTINNTTNITNATTTIQSTTIQSTTIHSTTIQSTTIIHNNTTINSTTNITSQEVAITCSTHSFLYVDNSTGGGCKQVHTSDLVGNFVASLVQGSNSVLTGALSFVNSTYVGFDQTATGFKAILQDWACSSGQYATGVASHSPTCAQVQYSQLGGTPSIVNSLKQGANTAISGALSFANSTSIGIDQGTSSFVFKLLSQSCPTSPQQYVKVVANAITCAQVDIAQVSGNIVNSIKVGAATIVGDVTFAGTSPVTVTSSGSTVTVACPTCSTSTPPKVTADFYNSGSGRSIAVTTSYAEVLPQQTRTPMDMTGYSTFKMFAVLTTPSLDPSIVQQNSGNCAYNCGGSTTPTIAYSSNVVSGHLLVVSVGLLVLNRSPSMTVTDSQGNMFTSLVSATNSGTPNYDPLSQIFTATAGSSAADTVTLHITTGGSQFGWCGTVFELIHATAGNTGTGTGTGTALSTSSTSFTGNAVAIAAGSDDLNLGSPTWTAGTGFTSPCSVNTGATEYSTTISSPTTFPLTQSLGDGWAEAGAMFVSNGDSATISFKTQYSTNGGSSWTDVSSSTLDQSTTVTDTYAQSSYFSIASGAKGDYLFRCEVVGTVTATITLYKFGVEVAP